MQVKLVQGCIFSRFLCWQLFQASVLTFLAALRPNDSFRGGGNNGKGITCEQLT